MNRRVAVLLGVAGVWLGCHGNLLKISVDQSAETVVDHGTVVENLVGDLGFSDFLDMDLTAASELQNQGVEPGDIQEVYLTSFQLEAVDPQDADLSFLSDMTISVEAPDLPSVVIAEAHDFPVGEPLVDFDLKDVDLTDYVVSQSMTFTTDVTGHRPDADTTVDATFSVSVGVTRQGACNYIKRNKNDT